MILLVIWSANGDVVLLSFPRLVSKVNLLNDDTYQWIYVTVIVSSWQIEQGVHYLLRKSLIYSSKKAFLECTALELVYKFDKKCTESV